MTELAESASARAECENMLAAAVRVAAEAMKLLTREQLIDLRHTLDSLEVGDGGKDSRS